MRVGWTSRSVLYHDIHNEFVSGDPQQGYRARSTILTAQLPVARWHEQIGDPTAAHGILDRLVHNAHRIEMRRDYAVRTGGIAVTLFRV